MSGGDLLMAIIFVIILGLILNASLMTAVPHSINLRRADQYGPAGEGVPFPEALPVAGGGVIEVEPPEPCPFPYGCPPKLPAWRPGPLVIRQLPRRGRIPFRRRRRMWRGRGGGRGGS